MARSPDGMADAPGCLALRPSYPPVDGSTIRPDRMDPGGAGIGIEAGLVERARSGDADAFDALVGLRLRPAFRLARAILGTTEEAEDATQEAFIAAWRSLPSLNDPGRFDAWFTRIVVNSCRMSMRRRPRGVVLSLESVADAHALRADDRTLDGLAQTDALNWAIDRLPVPQRAILALYYLEDRPLLAVAAILGIPTGTAKWQLSEARAGLRRALAADDELPSQRRGSPRGEVLTADLPPIIQPLPEAGA